MALNPPEDLAVTFNSPDRRTFSITDTNGGTSRYRLERRQEGDLIWHWAYTTDLGGTVLEDEVDFPLGTVLEYRAVAYTTTEQSSYTAVLTVTVEAASSLPSYTLDYMGSRGQFVYGHGESVLAWTSTLAQRPWTPAEDPVGSRRIGATGTGASHIVRRDGLLDVPLLFREPDWPDLVAMLRWGQAGEQITWDPDVLETGVPHVVWLERPAAGDGIQPTRLPDYPRVLELSVQLRRADLPETAWDLDYFGLGT